MANEQTTEGVSTAAAGQPAATEIARTPTTDAKPSTSPATPSTPASEPVGQGTENKGSRSLTDDPQFREWQAGVDRERQQLRSAYEQTQQRLGQAEQEAEALRLANADDGEKAAYYANQVRMIRGQQQQAQVAEQWRRYYNDQAVTMLKEAGLDWQDKDIKPYLAGGATQEGMAQLAVGIAKVSGARLKEAKAEAEKARTRGAQEALNEAGVTTTSNAAGASAGDGTDAASKYAAGKRKIMTDKSMNPEKKFLALRKLETELGL